MHARIRTWTAREHVVKKGGWVEEDLGVGEVVMFDGGCGLKVFSPELFGLGVWYKPVLRTIPLSAKRETGWMSYYNYKSGLLSSDLLL